MPTPITLRRNESLALDDILRVLKSSGIARPVREPERIREMFDNANLIVSAWSGDRLVGVARALTDFSYCCYLSDLAVERDFQRQGIGRALIAEVRAAIGEGSSLMLLAAPDAEAYYPALGFEQLRNAYRLPRKH